ncbi:peptide chain release factor 1, mitochondrial [Spea bombifrons]|uniref:peptide chain release factor 1, mitochondrial n=1 Tax=Spea bombifrons TaxID=233779 RepID=UPI00234A1936|nr:peptide chain release factor 1, mitochondrial [Spea bombifrons]
MRCPLSIGLWKSCLSRFHFLIPTVQRTQNRFLTEPLGSHLLSGYTFLQQQPGQPLRRYHYKDSRSLWQSEILQSYLNSLIKEHEELNEMLSHVTVRDEDRRTLGKRHAELSALTSVLEDMQAAEREARELESMCADLEGKEKEELLELALTEKDAMNQNIDTLRGKLLQILVPREKYDMSDAILEVTSGRTTGGDICQQFTKEVFEMYQNYAYYKSWCFEILNYTPSEYGGLHHAAARISGDGVYKLLKYEGGTHRVQRIPEVGLSSRMQRIHTGTMAVIVLPQPDEIDIRIDPKDLRIDTFRAKGAGGQHVNTTDSAVRVVHIPTGIIVECQQERSQIINKDKALRMLQAKLHEQTVEKELSQRQSARKLQVGTRAQSDRIRTYNFTQDRVTDHRISYEARNIKEFLSGEKVLDDLINKLQESADTETFLEVIEKYTLKLGR